MAWRRPTAVPRDPEAVRLWLYGVARRTLANAERSRGRSERVAAKLLATTDTVELAPDLADGVVERARIREALGSLSALDQETLRLVAWEGLDLAGAARSWVAPARRWRCGCTGPAAGWPGPCAPRRARRKAIAPPPRADRRRLWRRSDDFATDATNAMQARAISPDGGPGACWPTPTRCRTDAVAESWRDSAGRAAFEAIVRTPPDEKAGRMRPRPRLWPRRPRKRLVIGTAVVAASVAAGLVISGLPSQLLGSTGSTGRRRTPARPPGPRPGQRPRPRRLRARLRCCTTC